MNRFDRNTNKKKTESLNICQINQIIKNYKRLNFRANRCTRWLYRLNYKQILNKNNNTKKERIQIIIETIKVL